MFEKLRQTQLGKNELVFNFDLIQQSRLYKDVVQLYNTHKLLRYRATIGLLKWAFRNVCPDNARMGVDELRFYRSISQYNPILVATGIQRRGC